MIWSAIFLLSDDRSGDSGLIFEDLVWVHHHGGSQTCYLHWVSS